MSKPKMHQFMGDKTSQKENEVTITYDPSVIKRRKSTTGTTSNENIGKIGNDTANMSLAMSMGKDERIYKMTVAYDKGELMTIMAIADYLDVSYATAKKYVSEAGIKVFDNKLKKYTEGRTPKSFK